MRQTRTIDITHNLKPNLLIFNRRCILKLLNKNTLRTYRFYTVSLAGVCYDCVSYSLVLSKSRQKATTIFGKNVNQINSKNSHHL